MPEPRNGSLNLPRTRAQHGKRNSLEKIVTTRNLWILSLGLAGILQCGMALYHFALPYATLVLMHWIPIAASGDVPGDVARTIVGVPG